jgi:hypothetical protein
MMMGRHAAGLLAKQGIIPVVVSPNPRDPTQSVRCPLDPCWTPTAIRIKWELDSLPPQFTADIA